MKTTIYDKILKKGEDEVNKILAEAKKEAKKITDEVVNNALKAKEERINKAEAEANKVINHQEKLLELEKRQALLTAKQNVINDVFSEVLNKLNKFEGNDLLDFVSSLIEKETVLGTETIYVNNKDYPKYLKALSTNKKGNLVDLDLLNEKLKTKFKLSNEAVNIEDGFLIEGTDFDLNFSISDLVLKLRGKHEREIAEQLFN